MRREARPAFAARMTSGGVLVALIITIIVEHGRQK